MSHKASCIHRLTLIMIGELWDSIPHARLHLPADLATEPFPTKIAFRPARQGAGRPIFIASAVRDLVTAPGAHVCSVDEKWMSFTGPSAIAWSVERGPACSRTLR